jgi:acyl-CoA thioesterase FadM
MALERFELFLPRNAFNPRDVARSGDVWRALQDAAVLGSSRRGWPPRRYREEKCGFIVRRMAVVHHRELEFGDAIAVETWVASFVRGMITQRQIRLSVDGQLAVEATQEWVFVATEGSTVRPTRAPPSITSCFAFEDRGPPVEVAAAAPGANATWRELTLQAWYGWMDPLAHANHPQYVDWCDEAIAREVAAEGKDPFALVPVSEEVAFRSGVVAPERVTVQTASLGEDAAGNAVFVHRILGGDGRLCATATLTRAYAG